MAPPRPAFPPRSPSPGRRVYAEITRNGEVRLWRTRPPHGQCWTWPDLDLHLAAHTLTNEQGASAGEETVAFQRQLARTHLPLLIHRLPFPPGEDSLLVDVDLGMGIQWVRATGR